jgi:methionine synthase II (cobalamin-independent)
MKTIVCGRWNRHSSGREEAKDLWKVRNSFDLAQSGHFDLLQAQDDLTRILLKELEETGVDILGDGGFRPDSVYDFARAISGCKGFRQLARIPQTNHFHRQPSFQAGNVWGLISRRYGTVSDLLFAKMHTEKPVVACLPGPYSLARQTANWQEVGLLNLASIYADVLNDEIRDLICRGASFVRVEDPQILAHPEDWKLFQEVAHRLTQGMDQSQIALATWYDDARKLDGYFDLPFGVFFVDLVEGKKTVEILPNFPRHKRLVAGVFDAREIYEEVFEEFSDVMDQVLRYVPRENVLVSTNTDLHFLPWDEALLKVKRMVEYVSKYKEAKRGS